MRVNLLLVNFKLKKFSKIFFLHKLPRIEQLKCCCWRRIFAGFVDRHNCVATIASNDGNVDDNNNNNVYLDRCNNNIRVNPTTMLQPVTALTAKTQNGHDYI